jgi:GTP-binding protein Era
MRFWSAKACAERPIMSEAVSSEQRRFGFIAVIGAPNAGKSTLVNALVGAKVSIVSHKVQTTRAPVRGIAIEGDSQLVFIDTPGLFAPRRRLDEAMVEAAWGGAKDADLVVLVVDAVKGIDVEVERILARLKDARAPLIAVLNKVDKVGAKEKLLALAGALQEQVPFEAVYMISALSGDGIADLKRELAARMPEGPWHYPAEDLSDAPLRILAAEITREKIYNRLHDELPYATTVETTSWQERKDGSVRIEQTIFVQRAGQKAIVLGKGGQTIKQISTEARVELAAILERPVHLFLFVKVREGWQDDPERYREMGLELPKK